MVDASHPFWFGPDVQKELCFSGFNPQSTKKIKVLMTSLWGLFPNGSHCLFLLLYKVQFLLVHEILWGLFPNGSHCFCFFYSCIKFNSCWFMNVNKAPSLYF